MADHPAKTPPSATPLSPEDADRLAESFTPFWEADSEVGPAPAAVPVTAAAPAISPAPIVPLQPAPRPAERAPQKTLLGFAPPVVEPPPASVSPALPAQRPTDTVPGYAIAYTPKDGPGTPAVVIAPEAQAPPSAPMKSASAVTLPPQMRSPLTATIPSQVRSSPLAAPKLAAPRPVAGTLDDDLEIYPKKKQSGAIVFGAIGGAVLLLAIVGIKAVSGGSEAPAASATATNTGANLGKTENTVTIATNPAPTATNAAAEPSIPVPEATSASSDSRSSDAAASSNTSKTGRHSKTPIHTAVVQAKPAALPPPSHEPSTASFPSEPAPAKPASKGVIVRDTPF